MLIDDFITYIRAEKRFSDHTAGAYRRDLTRFAKFTGQGGDIDPALVTSQEVRSWIVSLSEEKLSPSSINRMISSLRSFFKWARKSGMVENDPFAGINFLKKPRRLPSYVPESRIGALVDTRPQERQDTDDGASPAKKFEEMRDRLIILMLYTTGMRLSELRDIRTGDFSYGLRELKVRGKGGKERIVPILPVLKDEISYYQDEIRSLNICIPEENFLFLTKAGKQVSRSLIYRAVHNHMAGAGLQGKKSPHVLRHTFATHMLNDGADIRQIQELLGHSSLSATQVYTHNSITQLKDIYRSAHPRSAKK